MSTQFGLNIGNDQSATGAPASGTTIAQNTADLTFLRPYTNWLRVALVYGADQADMKNIQQLALSAKAAGYKVIYGITAGADGSASTYYDTWLSSGVLAAAQWAQANGMDEFEIGNEEDWNASLGSLSPKTPAQIQADVRGLVPAVKKVFTGPVSYCTSEGMLQDWITGGIGELDFIYFNVYDTAANFQNIVSKIAANFGSKGGVSEWSTDHGYDPTQYSEGTGATFNTWFANDIKTRAAYLTEAGISKAFLFTWRYPNSGWAFAGNTNNGNTAETVPGFFAAFPTAPATSPGGTSTPTPTPPGTPGPTSTMVTLTGTFTGTFTGTMVEE